MRDVLVLLAGALVAGAVFERLKQSSLVGYLLAGVLIGPNVLGLVEQQEQVHVLAELGVALLLFTIGLEFSLTRLRAMGGRALAAGAVQVVATLFLAAGTCFLFGMSWRVGITIGAMVALSSTACVLRIMMRRGELESVHGKQTLAILLIQDIAVVPLVLIVSMLSGEGSATDALIQTGKTVGAAAVLVVVFHVLFNKVVPRVLGSQLMAYNRELPILLAFVTAIGSAWAAHAVHLSPALGAFVAGALLGSSPFATQVRADVSPLRTILVTLFFSAMGMFANPAWIAQHLLPVIGVAVGITLGKTIIIWAILRMMGMATRNGIATGVCLSQIGEFSFVLAELAHGKTLDDNLFQLLVSSTILTLIVTPYLVINASVIGAKFHDLLHPRGQKSAPTPSERKESSQPRIIIVGFGPAGQQVGYALVEQPVDVTVLELSPRSASAARHMGLHVEIGDATQADVLEHVDVASAIAVVITVPDPTAARKVVEQVRVLASTARVFVRARYHVYRWELMMSGAHVVIDEEERVGNVLAAELRRHLRSVDTKPPQKKSGE